jgi:type VI protein secretion system component VasK
MGPVVMLLVVAIALVCGFAGQAIGRPKGYPGAGLAIGLLLGVFGVVIVALMPETEAVKAARAQWQYQAQLAAAQQQYEIQAEAARRAGYPFPSPPPPGAWPPPPGWPPPNP